MIKTMTVRACADEQVEQQKKKKKKKKKKKRHLIHYIEIVAMNLTGKTCPEFFVKVIVPDKNDETTNERRSIYYLLRRNVPTVIDFYNSG